jgi:hypothetical protein
MLWKGSSFGAMVEGSTSRWSRKAISKKTVSICDKKIIVSEPRAYY